VYADALDKKFLKDLKDNDTLQEMIGEKTQQWVKNTDIEILEEKLNIDYSSVFLMNAKPIETSVMDAKDEILVGLQNPVMQFYFNHNFELNLSASHLQTPDHIAIELAFMQNLISKDEIDVQKEFLEKHLLNWAVPYFIGIKPMCTTPLYEELCDFIVEFLATDYEFLAQLK
jgi:TorA maturation chaperone TorD